MTFAVDAVVEKAGETKVGHRHVYFCPVRGNRGTRSEGSGNLHGTLMAPAERLQSELQSNQKIHW
jgi:hypothetical protein